METSETAHEWDAARMPRPGSGALGYQQLSREVGAITFARRPAAARDARASAHSAAHVAIADVVRDRSPRTCRR
jgi:hypothetical protein